MYSHSSGRAVDQVGLAKNSGYQQEFSCAKPPLELPMNFSGIRKRERRIYAQSQFARLNPA
jgi:hypothetical protein